MLDLFELIANRLIYLNRICKIVERAFYRVDDSKEYTAAQAIADHVAIYLEVPPSPSLKRDINQALGLMGVRRTRAHDNCVVYRNLRPLP